MPRSAARCSLQDDLRHALPLPLQRKDTVVARTVVGTPSLLPALAPGQFYHAGVMDHLLCQVRAAGSLVLEALLESGLECWSEGGEQCVRRLRSWCAGSMLGRLQG